MNLFSANGRLFFASLLILMLFLHGTALSLRMKATSQKLGTRTSGPLRVTIDHRITPQIVRSEDSEIREVKEGAFLSDKTRAFRRQQKAPNHGFFLEGHSIQGKKNHKNLRFSDLALTNSGDPFTKPLLDYHKNINDEKKRSQTSSSSSTNDFIEDIPLGDLTNLNTVEYKYFGYYQRIRQKLEQFWGQSLAAKAQQLAKNGIKILSDNNYMTTLLITLDHRGEIIAVRVRASSGISELDDAAIDSFNQAGPFPNPPRDLIVDGKVTLVWGFVVEG